MRQLDRRQVEPALDGGDVLGEVLGAADEVGLAARRAEVVDLRHREPVVLGGAAQDELLEVGVRRGRPPQRVAVAGRAPLASCGRPEAGPQRWFQVSIIEYHETIRDHGFRTNPNDQ